MYTYTKYYVGLFLMTSMSFATTQGATTKIIFDGKEQPSMTKMQKLHAGGSHFGAVLNGCYATQSVLNLFDKDMPTDEKIIGIVAPVGLSVAGHYLAHNRDTYHKVTAGSAVAYASMLAATYIFGAIAGK